MKLKAFLLGFFCIFCWPRAAMAGTESQLTAMPVFEDGGNDWRPIAVSQSTQTLVLISSAADVAGLGIGAWRSREIVNISTCANMALYPDNTYTAYSSSFGVVLSSSTSGDGLGDSIVVVHQGPIWAIWSQGGEPCGNGGQGAGGYVSFWNSKKRTIPGR